MCRVSWPAVCLKSLTALLTTVPRRATLAPAVRTLARTTLPKLPSPISFSTSNRSSRAIMFAGWAEVRCAMSCATVMLLGWLGESGMLSPWSAKAAVASVVCPPKALSAARASPKPKAPLKELVSTTGASRSGRCGRWSECRKRSRWSQRLDKCCRSKVQRRREVVRWIT